MEPLSLIFHGALVHGALYLLLVFCGGVIEQNPLAWKLAIAAAGVSYLSYAVQAADYSNAGKFFVFISVIVGAAAGIALLF